MAVTSSAAFDPNVAICRRRRGGIRIEFAFWAATLLPFVLFPNHLVLASQIAITALFALSLDLILGYAGIVSLGHAAFFGLGAYTAGIITKYGWSEPLVGLADRPGGRRPCGIRHELHRRPLPPPHLDHDHHGPGLPPARGGQQRGVADRRLRRAAGHEASARSSACFRFDLYGYTAYAYSLVVLFVVFLATRRLINSPFGLALRGIRENPLRMPAIGAPSRSHIRKIYTISAMIAGIAGAVLAQTTSTVSLGVLEFQRSAEVLIILVLGGAGRLYGGLVGAIVFMVARDQFSGIAPQYWYFWIGALLVTVVMLLPNGILGGLAQLSAALAGRVVVSAAGALHAGARQALRLAGRGQRHQPRHSPWRALCPDRAQRRRQDHAHQPDHRHAAPRRRPHPSRRCRHHRRQARRPRQARPGAHLPDQRAVPAPQRARGRDARRVRAARGGGRMVEAAAGLRRGGGGGLRHPRAR